MPLPRIRPLEAFPVKTEEGVMVALRDPEGICDDVVMLSPQAFFIATMMNGRNDVSEIRIGFARQFGGTVPPVEQIMELVEQLDKRSLLDTPSFRIARADVRRRFDEQFTREASHAGAAYPDKPEELSEMIKGYFGAGGGPGMPLLITGEVAEPPRGIMAPHIDFERGGPVYAHAYRKLMDSGLPSLVVVLGVAHNVPETPLVATRKGFETPFGVVETDQEAFDEFSGACGPWVTEEGFAHKNEHSIEFQLVWLKALFPSRQFRILPILTSSFEHFYDDKYPFADDRLLGASAALKKIVDKRSALIISSVDLSHVGVKFGDEEDPGEDDYKAIEAEDRKLLAAAATGNPEDFWNAGTFDANSRNVDALSAVATMLHVLSPVKGELLSYGQGPDPQGGVVSFASMTFK